ncbi:MAG TPA: hypothetical protein VGL44_11770 [Gaiellales bacterium]
MSDRAPRRRRGVVRSFVVGGLVGAAAAVVAPRLRSRRSSGPVRPVAGLEAFEGAPCWQHDAAQAASDGDE